MDLHLLDDFAARSVGSTLSEFTRAQRFPAPRGARRPPPHHRHRRLTTVGAGAALIALPSVIILAPHLP